MNVFEKLCAIQTEIKAPKNMYNKFGQYYYRNAEGICEALKPFLAKYKATVIITDDIEQVGTNFYVKATVTFIDCEAEGGIIRASAYARETLDKKGMDASQITGACSSYARKYALNGMFLLDDTKDADSNEQREYIDNKAHGTEAPAPNYDLAEYAKIKAQVLGYIQRNKVDTKKLEKCFGISNINDISYANCKQYIETLKQNGRDIDGTYEGK